MWVSVHFFSAFGKSAKEIVLNGTQWLRGSRQEFVKKFWSRHFTNDTTEKIVCHTALTFPLKGSYM